MSSVTKQLAAAREKGWQTSSPGAPGNTWAHDGDGSGRWIELQDDGQWAVKYSPDYDVAQEYARFPNLAAAMVAYQFSPRGNG